MEITVSVHTRYVLSSLTEQVAHKKKHERIGVEHVVLALLELSKGYSPELLAEICMNPVNFRGEMDKLCPAADAIMQGAPQREASIQELTSQARLKCSSLGHSEVTTGHLLLASLEFSEVLASFERAFNLSAKGGGYYDPSIPDEMSQKLMDLVDRDECEPTEPNVHLTTEGVNALLQLQSILLGDHHQTNYDETLVEALLFVRQKSGFDTGTASRIVMDQETRQNFAEIMQIMQTNNPAEAIKRASLALRRVPAV